MRDDFDLAGVTAAVGADHFYDSVERAVAAFPAKPEEGLEPST